MRSGGNNESDGGHLWAEKVILSALLSLDLKEFLEVLKISPADSTAVSSKSRRMLQREFSTEARLLQHHRDVGLDLKYAMPLGQELRLSRVHLDILGRVIGAGDGKLNRCTGIREIRRRGRKPPSEMA